MSLHIPVGPSVSPYNRGRPCESLCVSVNTGAEL